MFRPEASGGPGERPPLRLGGPQPQALGTAGPGQVDGQAGLTLFHVEQGAWPDVLTCPSHPTCAIELHLPSPAACVILSVRLAVPRGTVTDAAQPRERTPAMPSERKHTPKPRLGRGLSSLIAGTTQRAACRRQDLPARHRSASHRATLQPQARRPPGAGRRRSPGRHRTQSLPTPAAVQRGRVIGPYRQHRRPGHPPAPHRRCRLPGRFPA